MTLGLQGERQLPDLVDERQQLLEAARSVKPVAAAEEDRDLVGLLRGQALRRVAGTLSRDSSLSMFESARRWAFPRNCR